MSNDLKRIQVLLPEWMVREIEKRQKKSEFIRDAIAEKLKMKKRLTDIQAGRPKK